MPKTNDAARQKDKERMDAEANQFAMELLMPEFMVRTQVEKIGGTIDFADDKDISKLARLFEVDIALMTLRLTQIYGVKP